MTENGLLALKEICDILDILEPRHIRQVWRRSWSTLSLWSYSFSMLRRRKAILALKPSMKNTLDTLTQLHCWRFESLLFSLDDMRVYKNMSFAAWQIIVAYEGICSMAPSDMVNDAAKDHLRSVLKQRVSCLLHMLFPSRSCTNKLQREKLRNNTEMYNNYSSISELLRSEYRNCSARRVDRLILSTHRYSSGFE
jgi:hypothetical protein